MKINVKNIQKDQNFNYVIQVPKSLNAKSSYLLVLTFHGSIVGKQNKAVQQIYKEYQNGRWWFNEKVNNSTIFVTPIIERKKEVSLSNNLEIDPQSLFRGSVHKLCKSEFPNLYNPHIKVKHMLDEVFYDFKKKIKLQEKILIIGISAGGSFASRFSFIYPEIVHTFLSFLNTDVPFPCKEYGQLELPFPFGLAKTKECPDINISTSNIKQYARVLKHIVIDKKDDRIGKRDSLYWEIDKEFYLNYVNLFGKKPYERAIRFKKIFSSNFAQNLKTTITEGYGHSIDDKLFDRLIIDAINNQLRVMSE